MMTLRYFPIPRPSALAVLSLLGTLAWTNPSIAGEYADRSGQCYFFRGETLELQEACKLSTGL